MQGRGGLRVNFLIGQGLVVATVGNTVEDLLV